MPRRRARASAARSAAPRDAAEAPVGSLAARCVLLAPGRELSPGEILWNARGRIVAIRRARGPVADLCILPGLVNAHAHLQLPGLPAGRARHQFLPWVADVMATRAAIDAEGLRRITRDAAMALLAEGVTAVGEVDALGSSMAVLAALGLRGRCYQEVTGFHLGPPAARALLRVRRVAGAGELRSGWSPHAPYSVSPALWQAAAAARLPLAVHCAELPEEQQFLHTGRGPFADLLQRLGRLPADHRPPHCGAVRYLEQLGVLRRSTQLVHCQELERGDAARIAAAGSSIAVCPGTIAWFRRQPPPVPAWLAAGIPVALGTDSRASNAAFAMRAELAAAARWWPELSPTQVFAMATTAGARSLAVPGLGRLSRGGRADCIAVPAAGDRARDHLDAFVHDRLPVVQVWLGGRCVHGGA